MKPVLMAIGAAVLLASCKAQESTIVLEDVPIAVAEVSFSASDSQTVFAQIYYSEAGRSAPLILLFHQAGANGRAEYASIIPKLIARDYNLLVVDQRSGGNHFGGNNRTVDARGSKTAYCPAYADLEAAVDYAKAERFDGPRFAWGSSYSAALVLKLAGEHGDDLAGTLSFSPASGSGMGACAADQYVPGVDIPAIGFRPGSEMNSGGQAQRDLFESAGHDFYVAENGVHGSSMLDPARTDSDVEPTWDALWAFLDAHTN